MNGKADKPGQAQGQPSASAKQRIDARISPSDVNRWRQLQPVLDAQVAKLLPVYRQATPEARALLLAHNPIFAALVQMMGV